MTLKHKILILLFAWTLNINAQKTLTKSKSFGLGFSYSLTMNTPNIANTPYLFFKSNRHEFFSGLDVYNWRLYTGSIFGLQAGYKFYFRRPEKIFNVYIAGNFQYVQFGQGILWAVPYNYLPNDVEHKDYNLLRTRSFSNTYGVGISLSFLKRFTFLLEFSGGYNYSETSFSPTNDTHMGLYLLEPGSKTISTPFIKIGLGFKIYKWSQVVKKLK